MNRSFSKNHKYDLPELHAMHALSVTITSIELLNEMKVQSYNSKTIEKLASLSWELELYAEELLKLINHEHEILEAKKRYSSSRKQDRKNGRPPKNHFEDSPLNSSKGLNYEK